MIAEFQVFGVPAPQGSKKAFVRGGHASLVDTSKALAPWRNDVARAANDLVRDIGQLKGPLRMRTDFYFPMPASRSKAQRALGVIAKTTAPDIDKLLRGVCDGLMVGGLIRDDALIVDISACKYETITWTGAMIRVEEM